MYVSCHTFILNEMPPQQSHPPTATALALAERARKFLQHSTDPFHAVQTSIDLFLKNYQKLTPSTVIAPGGRYYYTIANSTLVAIRVGKQFESKRSGITVIGGHVDSPNLRLKPYSIKQNTPGQTASLAVQCYGGGLWHTWLDRDLGLSGVVHVSNESGQIQPRLVQFQDPPLARISSLCIHLQSAEERKALAVNKEDHLLPVVGMEYNSSSVTKEQMEQAADQELSPWLQGQAPALVAKVKNELQLTENDEIIDWDLQLFDAQPPAVGGVQNDFLYAARLDNLATVFVALEALKNTEESIDDSADVSVVVAFDHEEVGSTSTHGAGSPVLEQALRRISMGLYENEQQKTTGKDVSLPYELFHQTLVSHSLAISMDQAHAIHPAYPSKHDKNHAPVLNGGVVVKTNANQRYMTHPGVALLLRQIARKYNIPLQDFCVRNDCPCGSTIGPLIASRTGIRTIDIGMPQLSMHSIREMMGVQDLEFGCQLLQAFLTGFRAIDETVAKDIV